MAIENSAPVVLVADDQQDVLEALRFLIKGLGYQHQFASSPAEVLRLIAERDFDLLVIDLNYARDTTSGQEGLDLLSKVQALEPDLPIVVMTAWASIELAVESLRRGAKDFIQKPWDNNRLATILQTQITLSRSRRKERRLEAENQLLRNNRHRSRMIAKSQAMQPVLDMIMRVGPSDANVLITGENGTGKSLIAQELHAVSLRAQQPLVTVNVGGLSEGIFESELFGHVKGAFTDAKMDRVGRFELAQGGSLFLDEIANIPPNLQAKLLRVLETGEFERVGSSKTHRADVRIISATNADLHAEVSAGKYRQDLLFRLNTIEIHIPPLRDRSEDILLLAENFLRDHSRKYRKTISDFDSSAIQMLNQYQWPGNVRELDHVIHRAVLMCKGDRIYPADLGLRPSEGQSRLEDMSLDELEKFLIQKTLARCDGNAMRAASALGLSRSAFYRRLQKHGL